MLAHYPWMDHLMAESLVKAHENGTLQSLAEGWSEVDKTPHSEVLTAITVDAPEEKCTTE